MNNLFDDYTTIIKSVEGLMQKTTNQVRKKELHDIVEELIYMRFKEEGNGGR